MSRKINRRQISPVKIKPVTEQRRSNFNSDVQRIINHAAKLIAEYNKNALDKLMEEDLDNQTKIDKLVKASKSNLPKISLQKKSGKSKKGKKRKLSIVQNKTNETENESDKINYNINHNSFEDTEFVYSSLTSNEYFRTGSLTKHEDKIQDTLERKSPNENVETDSNSENLETLSKLSFEKSACCSICSAKQQPHSTGQENIKKLINKGDLQFMYEIEVKTADKENLENNSDVFIQLCGESNSMNEPIILNKINKNQMNSQLFRPGCLDKFSIILDEYIGSILNVKIGIESENKDSSWNLDYMCVRDCLSKKDYFFSCRRWLGINSPDKLTQITLGYTPPFKIEKHASLSKSNTENFEQEKYEESIKSKKSNSMLSRTSSSSSNASLLPIPQSSVTSYMRFQQYQLTEENSSLSPTIDKLEGTIHLASVLSDEKKNQEEISSSSSSGSLSSETSSLISSSLHESVMNDSDNEEQNRSFITSVTEINIHEAVKSSNVLKVKQLCEFDKKNKNYPDKNGCGPIHLAAIYFKDNDQCREIFNFLLSIDVDINLKSLDGLVSLHYAVINGNLLAVKYLMENCGADASVVDKIGNTSLDLANKYDFPEIVDYLTSINVVNSLENSNKLLIFNNDENSNKIENIINESDQDSLSDYATSESINDIIAEKDNEVVDVITYHNESIINNKIDSSNKDIDKENVETDDENISILANENDLMKKSSSIDSDDSQQSHNDDHSKQTIALNKNSNNNSPEKLEEPVILINTNQKMSVLTADEDSLENLENKQLDAENKGIMFHKAIPISKNYNIQTEKRHEFQIQLENDEISIISSDSNTSKVSSRDASMSPITPRQNSSNSLSDFIETNRTKGNNNSNNHRIVNENLVHTTENLIHNNNTMEHKNENVIRENSINEISKSNPISNEEQNGRQISEGRANSVF